MPARSLLVLALTAVSAVVARAEERFTLDNGLRVMLIPEQDRPAAVVALGVRAGVYNEPAGRCGLAHLAEHIFWYGATKSYPESRAFDALTREGPLKIAFQDVNAETMWNLTYFYAARPAGSIDLPLEIFAEKLAAAETASAELLESERKKVLMEIEQATANMERLPAMKKQLEREYRLPKAGIAAEVKDLSAEQVDAFLATNYRPDRAILLVRGTFDEKACRERVRALFGPLKARPPRLVKDAKQADRTGSIIASYDCTSAGEREQAALRLAAILWQGALAAHGRAYVEPVPGGKIRVVLFNGDAEALAKTRNALHEPLPEAQFSQLRAQTASRGRLFQTMLSQAASPAADRTTAIRAMLQSAINRLRFESDGGEESLKAIESLEREEIAAAARKYLTAENQQMSGAERNPR